MSVVSQQKLILLWRDGWAESVDLDSWWLYNEMVYQSSGGYPSQY